MTDTLASAVTEALRMRDELKAGGMTGEALDRGLELVLRQFWPTSDRSEPWHDLCANCRDYGLEMLQCPGDATCGRPRRHLPHDYGKPCWCPKGRRHESKGKPSAEDAMTQAAKPKKPMSRWGR